MRVSLKVKKQQFNSWGGQDQGRWWWGHGWRWQGSSLTYLDARVRVSMKATEWLDLTCHIQPSMKDIYEGTCHGGGFDQQSPVNQVLYGSWGCSGQSQVWLCYASCWTTGPEHSDTVRRFSVQTYLSDLQWFQQSNEWLGNQAMECVAVKCWNLWLSGPLFTLCSQADIRYNTYRWINLTRLSLPNFRVHGVHTGNCSHEL